jgi:hypothetical protein
MSDMFETEPEITTTVERAADQPTLLNQLRTTLKKKVERQPVLLEVPEREGLKLKISPNITQNQMKSWRKNAGEETKNGIDATKFATQVIAFTTIGFMLNGEEVFDENNNPLTFGHSLVKEMTNATRPWPDAVVNLFGLDPHVEAAALSIMEAAGWGESVGADDENPTN